jgi:hypothetical protein
MAFWRRWEVTINRDRLPLAGVTRWAVDLEDQPTVNPEDSAEASSFISPLAD